MESFNSFNVQVGRRRDSTIFDSEKYRNSPLYHAIIRNLSIVNIRHMDSFNYFKVQVGRRRDSTIFNSEKYRNSWFMCLSHYQIIFVIAFSSYVFSFFHFDSVPFFRADCAVCYH